MQCGWGQIVFQGNLGYSLEKTKQECQTACDRNGECEYADIEYRNITYQVCSIYRKKDNCTISGHQHFSTYLTGNNSNSNIGKIIMKY